MASCYILRYVLPSFVLSDPRGLPTNEGLIKISQYGNNIYQKELSMARAGTLGEIAKEIERLSPKDQLKLVEKLAHQLRKSGITVKRELDWKGLYGLGKGLWKGEDAQEYVNRMREERV
jgi:hypothetical protein